MGGMKQTPKSILISDKPLDVSKLQNALNFPGRAWESIEGKTRESTEPYKLLQQIFNSLKPCRAPRKKWKLYLELIS